MGSPARTSAEHRRDERDERGAATDWLRHFDVLPAEKRRQRSRHVRANVGRRGKDIWRCDSRDGRSRLPRDQQRSRDAAFSRAAPGAGGVDVGCENCQPLCFALLHFGRWWEDVAKRQRACRRSEARGDGARSCRAERRPNPDDCANAAWVHRQELLKRRRRDLEQVGIARRPRSGSAINVEADSVNR